MYATELHSFVFYWIIFSNLDTFFADWTHQGCQGQQWFRKYIFHGWKLIWEYLDLQNGGHFVSASMCWIGILVLNITKLDRAINQSLTLNMRGPSYLGLTRSISCRQDISSHAIDYIEYVAPSLTWGRILSTCVISMWINDTKCKYMFMFPLKKLARKGLNQNWSPILSMTVINVLICKIIEFIMYIFLNACMYIFYLIYSLQYWCTLVQECGISIAITLDISQSCPKLLTCFIC